MPVFSRAREIAIDWHRPHFPFLVMSQMPTAHNDNEPRKKGFQKIPLSWWYLIGAFWTTIALLTAIMWVLSAGPNI